MNFSSSCFDDLGRALNKTDSLASRHRCSRHLWCHALHNLANLLLQLWQRGVHESDEDVAQAVATGLAYYVGRDRESLSSSCLSFAVDRIVSPLIEQSLVVINSVRNPCQQVSLPSLLLSVAEDHNRWKTLRISNPRSLTSSWSAPVCRRRCLPGKHPICSVRSACRPQAATFLTDSRALRQAAARQQALVSVLLCCEVW